MNHRWRLGRKLIPVLTIAILAMSVAAVAPDASAAAQDGGQRLPVPRQQPLPRTDRGSQLAQRKLSPELQQRLATAGLGEQLNVIVRLTDPVDPKDAVRPKDNPGQQGRAAGGDREAKGKRVVKNLTEAAAKKRRNLEHLLTRRQALGESSAPEPLWIVNGVKVGAVPKLITELARRSDVARIDLDLPIAELQAGPPAEPGLVTIGAPDYWQLGHTGSGVTVGVIDSGADLFAAELAGTWRAGPGSWIDFVGNSPSPTDPPSSLGVSHGTLATGVIVGGAQSGTSIGVASSSKWIAARVFNQQGQATTSDVHAAFQWMLDPDGNPATDDAPRIVNNSWSIVSGSCNLEFKADVEALTAAGILTVFAAGNSGTASEGASPANYLDSFAVGAVDHDGLRWDDLPFGASNRGPTSCDQSGASRTFPDVVAPGVAIKTVEGAGFYTLRSGTSVAAPHVSGAAALLVSEFPTATVGQLRAALTMTAADLGPVGIDNDYGAGRIDVIAARAALLAGRIGGLAWNDENGNGQLDGSESGLRGITISLHGSGADQQLGTGDDELIGSTSTDSLGDYVFVGLAADSYRVRVDEQTVQPGSTLTTAANPTDVLLGSGEARTDVDFGYAPPPPGTVQGTIWLDADQDATIDANEIRLLSIGVDLLSAGPDQTFDTTDDVIEATAYTDQAGTYFFDPVNVAQYQLVPHDNALPTGATSTTGGTPVVNVGPGQAVTGIDFGYYASTLDPLFMSFNQGGQLNNGSLGYSDEDVLAWNGTSFSRFFDGSDVGLAAADIDGFQVIDSSTIALSINIPLTLADLGPVDDSDVLLFSGTLGEQTQGTFSMLLDGSDVGLTTDAEDIDALDLLEDGTILLSTRGPARVPGLGLVQDEDVLALLPSSTGQNSAGLWLQYFDGSDVELEASNEDVDAIDSDGFDLLLSTLGSVDVTGFAGEDHDIVACGGASAGPDTECEWTGVLTGTSIGIGLRDIDGLTVRPELPVDPNLGPGDGSWTLSLDRDAVVNGGALPVDELDVLAWDGSSFSLLFDASDLGITVGDLDGLHQIDTSTLLLSFDQDQTIGGLVIDDADIVEFSGQLGQNTVGTVSILFDGSDIGLQNNAGDIDALHRNPDGSFVVSIRGNRWLPGVGLVEDRDLLLFSPTSLGETTAGSWSILLDGSDNGLDSGSEDINAVTANGSSWSISTLMQANVGSGVFTMRDVFECEPPATGTCTWSSLISGSALGLVGYGIDGFSEDSS